MGDVAVGGDRKEFAVGQTEGEWSAADHSSRSLALSPFLSGIKVNCLVATTSSAP